MSDQTSLFNGALALIGERRVESPDDETWPGPLLKERWPTVRDAVFRAHPWNCLIERAALSRGVAVPAFGYSYRYELPADCLRVLAPTEPEGPFATEGRALLSDAETLAIRYVARSDDPAVYDALLVTALEQRLAMEVATRVTDSSVLQERLFNLYQQTLAKARSVDSVESPHFGTTRPAWHRVRAGR